MQFGRWYPLAAAGDHAPAGPGVFQVRTRIGLVEYPRGKSAMVHYGAADDVRAAARDLARAHPDADWLCRHLVDLDDAAAAPALAARLIRDFAVRFGTPPRHAMKLVDTEIPDPQLPPVPPPRPRFDKRRVSVSFLLTAAVLVGTVATVFTVFPARHNQLVTSAIDAHKRNAPWDLDAPDAKTLRAWTIAAAGHEPPLPAPGPDLVAIGARTESVLHRPAAVIRFRLGTDEITVVMQRARDVERRQGRRADGDLLAETWRRGRWTVVAVGPAATVTAWRPRIGGP